MNNHRLEINDLIDDAVNNAVARRNEALESLSGEESLLSLSDEEAKNVAGGATILGRIPIIIGLILNKFTTI